VPETCGLFPNTSPTFLPKANAFKAKLFSGYRQQYSLLRFILPVLFIFLTIVQP